MDSSGRALGIGMLLYPEMDQIDFTGPFEILARMPAATVCALGTERGPIRDHLGLALVPDRVLDDAPPLDVLLVPGGPGQQRLMHDERVLGYIRRHVESGGMLFSVCTGALVCGAAGVLRGRRATTHWSAIDLLPLFGAEPERARVVVDGNVVSTAGVTAGLDGALRVVALLRGDETAQRIQLDVQYAPEPPFDAGDPDTAPACVLADARVRYAPLSAARLSTAREAAARLAGA